MSELLTEFEKNKALLRFVLRRYVGPNADIEDLLHETFLRAFAATMHTDLRHPRAFLLKVARNLAISESKKKSNISSISIEDFEESEVLSDDRSESPEQRLADKRKLTVLVDAIASLPLELRETFIMRKVDELPFRQIATRLNVSVSTVEKRAAKALIQLDRLLRASGYDPAEYGGAVIRMAKKQKRSNTDQQPGNK